MEGRVAMMGAAFVAYLAVMTVVDLAANSANNPAQKEEVEEAPRQKNSVFTAPNVKVLYCISWGYKNTFQAVKQNLQARHPGLSIEGDNFPATPLKQLLAKTLFYVRMGLLLIMLTGTKLFDMFGVPVPEWYHSLQENKMMAMVGVFFMGNMVESNLLSSGAFEVSVNGDMVWSKLETGYLPSLEHLISLIDEKLGAGAQQFTPDFESLGGEL